jgi:hypothetical protein
MTTPGRSSLRQIIATLCLSVSLGIGLSARSSPKPAIQEQRRFSVEQEIVPIERPVSLAGEALSVLAREAGVASCLDSNNLTPDKLPASWFVASQVHLADPNEIDFVVLPNLEGDSQTSLGSAGCFLGASTGQFWILRKTPQGFRLALTVFTHSLTILSTRWNGLRDIEAVTVSVSTSTTILYRFDGDHYRAFKEHRIPNR